MTNFKLCFDLGIYYTFTLIKEINIIELIKKKKKKKSKEAIERDVGDEVQIFTVKSK
jgi:hypothetical protein